jgi:SAM-dependent methyltransferase
VIVKQATYITPKFRTPNLTERIFGRTLRDMKRLFGVESYLRTEDRRVLEQIIFPYFLRAKQYKQILFVGCQWYTRSYNKRFEEEEKNYWTIDIAKKRRRYGAKQHIVDGMQNMREHFPADTLDLILCNGVFGWGLDAKEDVEQAIQASFDCLREGGILVIGYDDIDERRPFRLAACSSLRQFEPFLFPPLATASYLTDTPYCHTFDFYAKA